MAPLLPLRLYIQWKAFPDSLDLKYRFGPSAPLRRASRIRHPSPWYSIKRRRSFLARHVADRQSKYRTISTDIRVEKSTDIRVSAGVRRQAGARPRIPPAGARRPYILLCLERVGCIFWFVCQTRMHKNQYSSVVKRSIRIPPPGARRPSMRRCIRRVPDSVTEAVPCSYRQSTRRRFTVYAAPLHCLRGAASLSTRRRFAVFAAQSTQHRCPAPPVGEPLCNSRRQRASRPRPFRALLGPVFYTCTS